MLSCCFVSRRTLRIGAAASAAVVTGAMAACPAAAQVASSAFNTDAEGWVVQGDATSATPTYNAGGGNPGGHISAVDTVSGGVWYWVAPAKFRGNVGGAYNNTLTFDLMQSSTTSQFNAVDISITGNGLTLVFDTPANPGTTWTPYSVLLREDAGWRVDTLAGPAPSADQMQGVLSSVTSLRIRGEFRDGADTGRLDNVILNGIIVVSAPEPATCALLFAGLLPVLGIVAGKRRGA